MSRNNSNNTANLTKLKDESMENKMNGLEYGNIRRDWKVLKLISY